jgi:hypothetical protein
MAHLTRMATLKAHLTDLDGDAEGCLTDSDGIKDGIVDGSLNSDGIDDSSLNSDDTKDGIDDHI